MLGGVGEGSEQAGPCPDLWLRDDTAVVVPPATYIAEWVTPSI